MKINKKLCALIAGLAGVVLCVALMLFSCNGGSDVPVTEPSLADGETAAAEETSDVTEETAEGTTEDPTEETTEPEETTEATQASGNSTPGGTGGFQGGSSETTPPTTEPTEPEELIDAAAGSKELPYAENLTELPEALSTVLVPAGKTVSYQFFGGQGTVLTIADPDAYVVFGNKTYEPLEGVVTIPIPADAQELAPVSLTVGNRAAAEKDFELNFDYPLGSEQRPVVLAAIDQLQLQLGGEQGSTRYYSWTASDYGKLTLKAESVDPTDVLCTIGMTITSTDANGVTQVVTGTVTEAGTVIDMDANDQVIICVSVSPGGKEAEISIAGSFEPTLGTLSNPIAIPDVLIPTQATLVPGETTYYSGWAAGMELTITAAQDLALVYEGQTFLPDDNGVITVTFPAGSGMGPAAQTVFGLTVSAEEARAYTLTFAYPAGHPQNPAELAMGENNASIAANDENGYNYVWTAEGNGKLTITMTSEAWQYILNNETAGVYGDICDSSLDPSVAVSVLDVAEGDLITLNVNGFDPEDPWAYPGGTVTFTALYQEEAGTEDNPIWITDPSKPVTVEVPAHSSVYLTGRIFDVTMTAENAVGASVTLNSTTYGANVEGLLQVDFPEAASMGRPQPVVFMLNNGTDADAVYSLVFHYPLGVPQNPDQLKLGENKAQLEANATDGYIFNWTAPADGTLSLAMSGDGWQFTVSNVTAGIYGDNNMSDADPLVTSETIAVSEGDLVTVLVNTYTPESFDTPAGEVVFTVEFESSLGTLVNPIPIVDEDQEDGSTITFTTPSQTAGKPVYYGYRASGFDLVITGEGDFTATYNGTVYPAENGKVIIPKFKAADMYSTAVVAIEGAGVFAMKMEPPMGGVDNPAPLNVTDYSGNIATLDGGSEGYYYTYTAEEDGTLTLTAFGEENPNGYQITVYNLTTYLMSEILDQTVGETMTVELKAGDTIQVIVNTFDEQDPLGAAPAGTVVFDASILPPLGTMDNPVLILDDNWDDGEVITFTTAAQTAGSSVYYSMSRAPGYDLVITGTGSFTAMYGGNTYTAQAGTLTIPGFKVDPAYGAAVLSLEGEGCFQFRIEPPVGTAANPVTLNVAEQKANVASLEAGSDGYYFLFTSDAAGQLTLTAEAADNPNGYQISAVSLMTYVSTEILDQTTGSALVIEVAAGDQIEISVNTFDAEVPFETPAGVVTFTAAFAPDPAAAAMEEFEGTKMPAEPAAISLGEGQVLGYLDLTKTEPYELVLDETTGYFHLNTLNGPVIYVNLGTAEENEAPYLSLKALMETGEAFGTGNVSFVTCLKQYIACADPETGLYPLTEDLAYMLQKGGEAMGWWNAASENYLFGALAQEELTLNPENGWLFACCVIGW